jgi:uncharacterized membrane protein
MQNKIKFSPLLLLPICILLIFVPLNASAAAPAVRAILFYSPTCGHCEKVINQDLPPIQQTYQESLIIAQIDVTQAKGQELYQAAANFFNIPDNRLGVPTMIVGGTILVGEQEIPQQLPGIIQSGLSNGGINWPDLPGLDQFTAGLSEPQAVSQTNNPWLEKFMRDPLGNSIAVAVLIGMIISLVWIAYKFVMGDADQTRPWPGWVVPVLAVIGIGIAVYMTFVETTQAAAICGPIGDCNSVQKSAYATLFGFLPVGVLGLLGYSTILIVWIVQRFLSVDWRRIAWLLLWGLSVFGVLFSIYLTFLEPFVIGATCVWCISSAIVMTLLLWATTPMAILGSNQEESFQPA